MVLVKKNKQKRVSDRNFDPKIYRGFFSKLAEFFKEEMAEESPRDLATVSEGN